MSKGRKATVGDGGRREGTARRQNVGARGALRSPSPSDARRRKPQRERSQATHDAIVEAAASLFAQTGLRAATTNRIAQRAGVSVGSLYQYFPSKHALLIALYERESARLLEIFQA